MHCGDVRPHCLLAAWIAVTVAGCASWNSGERTATGIDDALTKVQETTRRVMLEIEFVNVAMHDDAVDQSESLWQWVDETVIDAGVRGRLLANGVRVGVVANPHRFQARLDGLVPQQDVLDDFLSQASVASDLSHGNKRIGLRLGRRYELPLKQPISGDHVALVRLGEQTVGRTLSQAQHLFAITATSAESPEQIHLQFRPEIQHGDARQKWVSSDSAIRIDSRRETWSLPELDIDLTAAEQTTVVIAAAMPAMGLAKEMLTGVGADQKPQQVIMLATVTQIPSAIDEL